MKSEVLEFFKDLPKTPQEQFNKAFGLFRKSPGKSPASERFYNASGYTRVNKENLFYDLKQLHGITDAQIRAAKKTKIVKMKPTPPVDDFVLKVGNFKEATKDQLLAFVKQEGIEIPKIPTDYAEMKSFVKEKELISVSNKKVDLQFAIENFIDGFTKELVFEALNVKLAKDIEEMPDVVYEKVAATKEEVFTKAPDEVKESVKLRVEFPFLNELGCPDELHILVGKKFAHYNAWVAIHEALFVMIPNIENDAAPIPMTAKEIFELASAAVENFELNQLIYAELKHYEEHKEVLGVHPIFVERKLKEKIDKSTVAELTIRKSNLDNYIRRDEKKLPNLLVEAKEKLQAKINNWKIELELINVKLGFSAEK